VNLAQLAIEEDDTETAKEILGFVLENTKDLELLIQANSYLIEMKINTAPEKDFAAINAKLNTLLTEYEINSFTLSLQLIQAHFVAFNLRKPEEGKAIIKKALELQLNDYEVAQAKMELADILLFEEKFNQALLYYSQIEENLKNDAVAHEASLKAAKTSYFQGDFAWALKQFKELKSASTQLIANDALEYFLLINDNTVADSTQTALKEFAKGDYLLYQNRNQEAIAQFQSILKSFKGQDIEAVTLLRLGKIYEKQGEYNLALAQYQNIIAQHSDGIYIDEALYFSAEIESNKLHQPEKAKPLYEKIIFNHQDSIYFVEARKKYRQLRGDIAP
jgi:tetratricopeptide (TPR) repeat protein